MGYINQPFDLRIFAQDIYARLNKLETATRFTAPVVDFATNEPSNPRQGDIFYDLDTEHMVYWNGTDWVKLNQSNYP
jgi:hypothetical protein